MSVDKDTVAKIAKLARIRVSDTDCEALAGELSNILGWVEQLSEQERTASDVTVSLQKNTILILY